LAVAQPDPRSTGKIPLRLTWRATRVLAVATVFSAAFWVFVSRGYVDRDLQAPLLASSWMFALLPVVLTAANACLVPYERSVQRGYEADARRRIAAVQPFIV